ncbi:MAG: hypothetical protein IT382_15520 [Deltaproteobacteria bacterium]|nr:hypothetical protein [Deltaproteobacteria bacterium]
MSDVYDGYGGAQLAVWLRSAPKADLQPSGSAISPVVVAWPNSASGVTSGFVDVARLQTVLLAAPDSAEVELLKATAPRELTEMASKLGYSATLPRQLSGFWSAPDDDALANEPTYLPTGALLPEISTSDVNTGSEFLALDLVMVRHEWRPLSEAAIPTYSHARGMQLGERWRLTAFSSGARSSFSAIFDSTLAPADIAARFGREASARARPTRKAVVLRVRRDG